MKKDNIEQKVCFFCCQVLKRKIKLSVDDGSLADIGLNSIDFIRFVILLEEEFGFEFEDSRLRVDKETLRSVIAYVKKNI